MRRIAILIALSLAGVVFAGWTIVQGSRRPPAVPPAVDPAVSPFAHAVAGSGIVEPSSEVIAIGSPIGDVIAAVLVEPGRKVAAGAELLRLDDRQTRAQEAVATAAVAAAKAAMAAAASTRDEALEQAARSSAAEDADLLSVEERARRTFAVALAQARMAEAEAGLAQAEATLAAVRVELDRRVIRAPIAGTVLRVDARVGEFAPTGRIDPPLLTLGDIDHLQLRADIDENDAWRVTPGAVAEGTVRGNPELRRQLRFLRIEPYVVPKKSLTGLASERVDTRVLQVIYRFDRADLPIYPGQQMDVFIDTPDATPAASASASATPASTTTTPSATTRAVP